VSNDYTPASAIRGFWAWVPVALLVLAAMATLAYFGAEGSWWWQNQNANHQNQIIQNGNSNQSTLRDEITHKISDVEQMSVQIGNPAYAADKANIEQSRYYAASIVCGDAAQITGVRLRPAQDYWVRLNCSNGTVKVTSIYNVSQGAGS
jgi:hypothetical protein